MLSVDLTYPTRSKSLRTWTFEEPQRMVRIGRSRKNDVRLDHRVVSRSHAELECIEGQWVLKNTGLNGCYVDGQPVNDIPLEDGQVFRIGRTGPWLRVHIEIASGQDGQPEDNLDRDEKEEMQARARSRRRAILEEPAVINTGQWVD